MDKKGVHLASYLWYFLVVSLIIFSFSFLKAGPTPTGYFIYSETAEEKNWEFTNPTDYTYDDSLISLNDQQVKLISETIINNWTTEETIKAYVTSAVFRRLGNDPVDETTAIQNQDEEFVNLAKKDSLLDVTFDSSLDNGDIISLYFLEEDDTTTDIYLCDENTLCDAPGYGLVEFNTDEGWYNITLSGLSSSKNIFAINFVQDEDEGNCVGIDYVEASYIEIEEHSETSITYPPFAEIETSDFEPTDWFAWGTFTSTEELNDQSVDYQYSTDSGTSWEGIPANGDLSSVNSTKIRIKAILTSDETSTPILNGMSLTYVIQFCDPQPTNTSWSDWNDLEECQANNLKLQQKSLTQYDSNYCEEIENFTFVESQYIACDYCSLNNCTNSFEDLISSEETSVIIDALNETNTLLEINTTNGIEAAMVSIVKYNWTSQNNPESLSANKYVKIESDIEDITSVKITVYYTDEEIAAANLNENTLKIHYYNSSSGEWEELDSVVNTTGNYVYAFVSHLSLYGLFGDEQTTAPESPSSSGGDGDSGGGVRRFAEEKKEETLETLETKSEDTFLPKETLTEPACDYVLEISLPNLLSFLNQDTYEGEITNKGNCDIEELNFYSSFELDPPVIFSPSTIADLSPGNKTNFQIIRKTEKQSWPFSFFTGSAMVEKMIAKKISGTVTIEGMEKKEFLFTKKLPIDIEVLAPEKMIWTIKLALPGTGFVTFVLIFTVILFKRRKLKKNRNSERAKF